MYGVPVSNASNVYIRPSLLIHVPRLSSVPKAASAIHFPPRMGWQWLATYKYILIPTSLFRTVLLLVQCIVQLSTDLRTSTPPPFSPLQYGWMDATNTYLLPTPLHVYSFSCSSLALLLAQTRSTQNKICCGGDHRTSCRFRSDGQRDIGGTRGPSSTARCSSCPLRGRLPLSGQISKCAAAGQETLWNPGRPCVMQAINPSIHSIKSSLR